MRRRRRGYGHIRTGTNRGKGPFGERCSRISTPSDLDLYKASQGLNLNAYMNRKGP